jgi:hypothetical protein
VDFVSLSCSEPFTAILKETFASAGGFAIDSAVYKDYTKAKTRQVLDQSKEVLK